MGKKRWTAAATPEEVGAHTGDIISSAAAYQLIESKGIIVSKTKQGDIIIIDGKDSADKVLGSLRMFQKDDVRPATFQELHEHKGYYRFEITEKLATFLVDIRGTRRVSVEKGENAAAVIAKAVEVLATTPARTNETERT